MINQEVLQPATDVIRERAPNFIPRVGLILGSGLGPLADDVEDAVVISYQDLPGMPVSSVAGHAGELVLGTINGVSVACLKGRVHFYEGATGSDFKFLVRLLKHVGCESVILTNASGSLRREIGPGELVLVTDHINFQSFNPMMGPNDEDFGSRFFPMDDAYDEDLRKRFHHAAKKADISLHEGVYFSVAGPNFETPAEIRAFRLLGADVVGMSTVPEVLVARHCGLKVAVVAAVTNLSADMSEVQLTHEHTIHYANLAAKKLKVLIKTFFEALA